MKTDKIEKAPPRVKALVSFLGSVFMEAGIAPSEARQALTLIVEFIDESGAVEKEMALRAMKDDDSGTKH